MFSWRTSVILCLIWLGSVACENDMRIVWFMEKTWVDLTTVGCPKDGTIRDSLTGDITSMKFLASSSDAKLLVCVHKDINLFVFRIIIMKNKLSLFTEEKPTYKEGETIKVDCGVSLYIMDVYNFTRLSIDLIKDGKFIKSFEAFTQPNTPVMLRIDEAVSLDNPRLVQYQGVILDSKIHMECVLNIQEFNLHPEQAGLGREVYRKFSVMKESVTLHHVQFPLRKVEIGKTQAKIGEVITCQAEVFPPLYDCNCALNGEDSLLDNSASSFEWNPENEEDIIQLQLKSLEQKQFSIAKAGSHEVKCTATGVMSNITWYGEVEISEDLPSSCRQESCVCPSKATFATKNWTLFLVMMVFWFYF